MKIIRVKSDNFNCWMSEDFYYRAILSMSSGDYGSHMARFLEVGSSFDPFTDLNGREFFDLDGDLELYYDGRGDCIIESVEGA